MFRDFVAARGAISLGRRTVGGSFGIHCVIRGVECGLSLFGIGSSFLTLFLPPVVLGAALLRAGALRVYFAGGASRVACSPRRFGSFRLSAPFRGFDAACFALYVAFGATITMLVFAGSLDGSNSFVQEYDNIYHLSITYNYLHSGAWSSLDNSLYLPNPTDR